MVVSAHPTFSLDDVISALVKLRETVSGDTPVYLVDAEYGDASVCSVSYAKPSLMAVSAEGQTLWRLRPGPRRVVLVSPYGRDTGT